MLFDKSIIASISVMIFLSACGQQTFDIAKGGAFVDIDHRAIIVDKSVGNADFLVCAEPSPDAMAANSLLLSGKIPLSGQKMSEIEAGKNESHSFVGLRTSSIQLLRDFNYRLCEQTLNGGITPREAALLLRRNQRYIVALLAIEQLTGAVAASGATTTANTMAVDATSEGAKQLNGATTDIAVVAKTVENIVAKILDVDDFGSLCYIAAVNTNKPSREADPAYHRFVDECTTILMEIERTLIKSDSPPTVNNLPNMKKD